MPVLLRVPNFYDQAPKLRKYVESVFEKPREAKGERFVWDYWHVPDQYTLLRTPADHFFPAATYRNFLESLIQWGRQTLGCHSVSPPWLSCYVEGCEQRLHADVPHGPWAFVYSLTPWRGRCFRGGETILLKESVLNHWQGLQSGRGLELDQLQDRIPAQFNQLLVFDPRVPHGVERVSGTHDVLQGRLVIHGWFVQPRPFIQGRLATRALSVAIDEFQTKLPDLLEQSQSADGVISLQLKVAASGKVQSAQLLTQSLRLDGRPAPARFLSKLQQFWRGYEFPRSKHASLVTLPVVFETNG